MRRGIKWGKIFYALVFIVLLPLFLWIWSICSQHNVRLPVWNFTAAGWVLLAGGVGLMASGMAALLLYGNGLPMNAYPPSRYVFRGVYRFLAHPIYAGFSLACIGTAMLSRSASGLWLVSPTVVLGCVALVLGYEKPDLLKRFGSALPKPLLHLPASQETTPTWNERLSVYLLVLLPWLILYEAVRLIGPAPDAVSTFFPFERRLPVWEWTEIFYFSVYLFVLLAPALARTRRDLREFSLTGLLATALIFFVFLTVPFNAPPRPFVPHTFLGHMLAWERKADTAAAAFPSFHVVWAWLAALVYGRRFPSAKAVVLVWAGLISASCLTTGMHSLADVLAGFVVLMLLKRAPFVWEVIRRRAEKTANSWKEWRKGRARIINHGLYAGIGSFVAFFIIGTLLGPRHLVAALMVAFSILVTAGLWAQIIEGSPALLRPYGYYGGIVGGLLGSLLAHWISGSDFWLMLAAFAVAGPWVQAAGRIRCLVQGCCHGREAPPSVGIRYVHPRSRVCYLAHLSGVPLHPTPVYSILWNGVVAASMARLWFLRAPLPLVAGLYLILTGLGRFVEESYRGEPQTPVIARLRFYQWVAVASVLLGAGMTMVHHDAAAPAPSFRWLSLAVAFFFGLCAWLALGVDFPDSNKRFARLV